MIQPAVSQFDYPPAVLSRFQHPGHAGSLPSQSSVLHAQAGARERGVSIQLWLQVVDSRVAQARFQAYGCPHFIAAAELLCEWCEGRSLDELGHWSWTLVENQLAIQAAKRGKLLILESALKTAIATSISTLVSTS